MKIIAICGGGDWADASVEHLILPDDLDLDKEQTAHRTWYRDEYSPDTRSGKNLEYFSLVDWLKQRGAREPTEDELDVRWDD